MKHIEADRECLKISNVPNSVKKWLDIMELGNLKSAGARYVFPILLAGTQLKQGQTLIIENPEIFLHPKNQMNLADFFISASSKQNLNVYASFLYYFCRYFLSIPYFILTY